MFYESTIGLEIISTVVDVDKLLYDEIKYEIF